MTAPASLRPEMTAALMARTGLSDEILDRLVRTFYARVRQDPLLAPVFAARVTDWEAHLQRLTAFWSSVALMTGRYHGRPVAHHVGLPAGPDHFARWLALFRATASEVCPPEGAAHVIAAAERIALSLQSAMARHEKGPEG
ncbi:group III truncated hemoglobin [Rubellimicrobium aerolatum]|uniref:Group III truncated hemoglobin n=1 Tax=Rubellimicrobium aerolatum TaxID=490979 RepID=A0ABW0SGN6_9RHOB|nr:group III truncated hemoglobin [Rubellimicrobium aerolatum]MBP1807410.1 hemoglobin [Rubellimicrobium aerolatum]